MGKEGYAAAQNNWKWNSEFYKKEELKDNSIYSSLYHAQYNYMCELFWITNSKLVTIGFALPSTNRGNMHKESPNDF